MGGQNWVPLKLDGYLIYTMHELRLVFIHICRCTVHTISLHFKTVCTGRKIPTKDNNFVHFSSLHPPVLGLDIYHIKQTWYLPSGYD